MLIEWTDKRGDGDGGLVLGEDKYGRWWWGERSKCAQKKKVMDIDGVEV